MQLRAPEPAEPDLAALSQASWLRVPAGTGNVLPEVDAADDAADVFEDDPAHVRDLQPEGEPQAAQRKPGGRGHEQAAPSGSAAEASDAEGAEAREHGARDRDVSPQGRRAEADGGAAPGESEQTTVPDHRRHEPLWAIANEPMDAAAGDKARSARDEWDFSDCKAIDAELLPLVCAAAVPDWEHAIDWGDADSSASEAAGRAGMGARARGATKARFGVVEVESKEEDEDATTEALAAAPVRSVEPVRGTRVRAPAGDLPSWDNLEPLEGNAALQHRARALGTAPGEAETTSGLDAGGEQQAAADGDAAEGQEQLLPGLKLLSFAPAHRALLDSGLPPNVSLVFCILGAPELTARDCLVNPSGACRSAQVHMGHLLVPVVPLEQSCVYRGVGRRHCPRRHARALQSSRRSL
jgi:hypothetical protein